MFDQDIVIGAGHIGLPFAVYLSTHRPKVTLVDIPERIEGLQNGKIGFFEPGLRDALNEAICDERIVLSTVIPSADEATMTFICIGDKSSRGVISSEPMVRLIQENPQIDSGTICIRSTVPIGTARTISQLVDRASVLSLPEFLREGCAMEDLRNTTELIVGTENEKLQRPEQLASAFGMRPDTVSVGSWETVEATKIARNVFNAMRIAIVNEIDSATSAYDIDRSFVGRRLIPDYYRTDYSLPGLPAGGSCLPAAMMYLNDLGDSENIPLLKHYRDSSMARLEYVAEQIMKCKKRRVLILGLAFKEGTDDLVESWSIKLALRLEELGAEIRACDMHVKVSEVAGISIHELDDQRDWPEHVVLATSNPIFENFCEELSPSEVTDLTGQLEFGGSK